MNETTKTIPEPTLIAIGPETSPVDAIRAIVNAVKYAPTGGRPTIVAIAPESWNEGPRTALEKTIEDPPDHLRVLRVGWYQHSILRVCDSVHGAVCGSGECYGDIRYEIAWLRSRRTGWSPSRADHSAAYEAAVLALVDATLAEFDHSWMASAASADRKTCQYGAQVCTHAQCQRSGEEPSP